MTTLTPGGQRLADDEAAAIVGPLFVHDFSDSAVSSNPSPGDVTLSCDHPATLTVAFMGNGMSGTLEEARANAAKLARLWNADLDAPPAGGDGGLREAAKAMVHKLIVEFSFCDHQHELKQLREAIARDEAALARPDPREQAAAGVGLPRCLPDAVLYALWVGGKNYSRTLMLEAYEEAFDLYASKFASHPSEAAAPSGSAGEEDATARYWKRKQVEYLARREDEPGEAWVDRLRKHFAAQQPAPQAPVADAAGVRDRWLDWRGGVEGKEASVVVATKAVKQARESGREYTDEEIARHVCWMIGLDHVWQHVEALRNALAARQAPEVATALRKEADRLLDRAAALAALTPPQAARPGDGESEAKKVANVFEALWLDAEAETARLASGFWPSDAAIAEAFHEHRRETQRSLPPWSDVTEGSGVWKHSHDFAARLSSLRPTAPVQADAAEGRS